MACWMKFTSLNSGSNLGGAMGGQHRYPSNTGMGLTIKYVSSTTGYLSLNTGTGTSRTYNTYCGKTLLNASTWYHVCFTYDGAKINLYVDGVLDGTHSYTGQKNVEDYINVFNWSFGSTSGSSLYGGYKLLGYMNDFRIYDHCLSPKEVKELSKGLVAHYRLAGEYNAGINLLKNSIDFSGASHSNATMSTDEWGNISATYDNTAATSGYKDFANWGNVVTVNAGEVYTASFFARSETSKKLTVYFYNNSTGVQVSKGVASNGATTSGSDGGITLTLTPQWERYWITWTFNSTTTALAKTLLFRCMYGNEVEVSLVKLEKGNKATPWTPAPTDSIYTAWTKEYDCSGYNNDGTISGTIDVSSDTMRNNASAVFNGAQYINCGQGPKVRDEITVNWWGYMDDWSLYSSTPMRAISCTEGGGWNFEPASSKMSFACGTGASANTYKSVTSTTTFANYDAGWHMFTGTYDGLASKIYIDGKLENTNSAYTTKTPLYYAANSIFIGAEAGSSTSTPAGTYFTGKISDVQIYGTALSAKDIDLLYRRSLAIDNYGNSFTGDYNELKADKFQTGYGNTYADVSELDGQMKIKELSDGSVWARIHWLDVTNDATYFTNATEVAYCTNKTNRFSLMGNVDKYVTRGIPSDYTRLDYIESTGTQYINTGYYWTSEAVKVVMDATVTSNSSSQSLFGNEEPFSGGRYFSIVPHGSSGKYSFYVGSSTGLASASTTVGTRFTMECETTTAKVLTVKVNGTTSFSKTYAGTVMAYANTTSTNANKGKIYIFANHNSGSNGDTGIQIVGGMKLYSFKMYDNGTMVRNFVPCKNSAGTIGLYDTMTRTFFTNAGSGTFTAGPVASGQGDEPGCYEFMLTYPQISSTGYNRWQQSSSPNASAAVGFKAISTSWSGHNAGIRKHGSACIYNCDSGGTWFAPIGQTSAWDSTKAIPAANGNSTTETELWVRIYPEDKNEAKIYYNSLWANKIYER